MGAKANANRKHLSEPPQSLGEIGARTCSTHPLKNTGLEAIIVVYSDSASEPKTMAIVYLLRWSNYAGLDSQHLIPFELLISFVTILSPREEFRNAARHNL